MAYTTITDPSAYFQTTLYTGTGSARSVTNDGNANIQPDWLWIKRRSASNSSMIVNSSLGLSGNVAVASDLSLAAYATPVSALNSDGFSVNAGDASVNANGSTYVSWQWKANGGTTASNSSGTITSTVQANTTSGFSIVTWTGSGANATIGHGLGVTPKMIIIKRLNGGNDWIVYHASLENASYYISLNGTGGQTQAANVFNSTAPTSSVFSVGTSTATNSGSQTYIAYCFADIQGYSKFANLRGNGNADGPFIYTGFKPAFVMQKEYSQGSTVWFMWDSKRDIINVANRTVEANSAAAEGSTASGATNWIDILSNGYKIRNTGSHLNASGRQYIYMAFAQNPFVATSGLPATAR
jgi:hypothetical protein